jgi:transposase
MPLSVALSPGNEHDSRRFGELLEGLSGAPRELYADSAYDTGSIRGRLSSMGVEANIPVNPRRGRMPRPYNADLYKSMRSAVERFYTWLKAFRRIVIRYERLATMYKALINVACITIHLRMGNEN